MPQVPTPEDVAKWHRWFAIEMNNCAWTLAENPSRSPGQREEMLDAAHAAAMHWGKVGTDLNRARADMLLGLVHALAGNGTLAMLYARRSHEYATSHACPDWELALAHAVLAHAAYSANEAPLYLTHYALAKTLGDSIADSGEREVFRRTFNQLPIPAGAEEVP